MRTIQSTFFALMMVTATLLSACTAGQPSLTDPPTVPDPTLTIPTQPTPSPEPSCPDPVEGTQLLRHDAHGYCLLYPDGLVRVDPLSHEVCLVPEGPAMACHTANAFFEVTDAAGHSASEIADKVIADARAEIPGIQISRTDLTVGGEAAVALEGLPGVASTRLVLIVHEGRRYDLIFIPWVAGDEFEKIERLYNIVINSFTFIHISQPPAVFLQSHAFVSLYK